MAKRPASLSARRRTTTKKPADPSVAQRQEAASQPEESTVSPRQEMVSRQIDFPIGYICRVASNTLLCCGHLNQLLTGKEVIEIDGKPVQKPYLAAMLSQGDNLLTSLLVRVEPGQNIGTFDAISFTRGKNVALWPRQKPIDETGEYFSDFLTGLKHADIAKLYYLLLKFSGVQPENIVDPHFLKLCLICLKHLEAEAVPHTHALWLAPDILYIESRVSLRGQSNLRAMLASSKGFHPASAEILSLPVTTDDEGAPYYPLLVIFSKGAGNAAAGGMLSLLTKEQLIALKPLPRAEESDIAGMLGYLRQLPETQRFHIRDFINRQLVRHLSPTERPAVTELARNLQAYLPPTHSSLCDKEQPFGLNIEAAYQIANEGMFVSGWLHDPLNLLNELTLCSDLGFTLPLTDSLIRYHREDIQHMYEDGAFPWNDGKHGFAAYIEFPEEHRARYTAWPESFAFRVMAELKGGLSYTVAPKPKLFDPFTLRKQLLSPLMASLLDGSEAAFNMLGNAARTVQAACTERVYIQQIHRFGTPAGAPKASVIIPLYKVLDYIPAQVAHFADDPSMAEMEVIYVLDSPEQEETLKRKLRDLSLIYRFPLKLAVLSHNGGYATACNLGASEARSSYLLLMNSDVLPAANGWLNKMIDCYDADEKIGAMAPKLLYEDGGIQHAGMYFAMNMAGEHFENLHYFKGYPQGYAAANVSRTTPAVSAACLLIGRKLFEKAGKFSTEYVVGDFEDSDLCMKLSTLGYSSYYLADVELYHFERQSFAEATVADALRYRINALYHHKRWRAQIEDIMETYHG